ncbi:MAG TPA: hypothetical protein VIL40_04270 [Thermaerobacter sp.]
MERERRPRPRWREWLEVIRFLRDPRAGAGPRLVVLLAALYLLWPADLLPGLPPLSWLDDATAVWIAYGLLRHQLERARRCG